MDDREHEIKEWLQDYAKYGNRWRPLEERAHRILSSLIKDKEDK